MRADGGTDEGTDADGRTKLCSPNRDQEMSLKDAMHGGGKGKDTAKQGKEGKRCPTCGTLWGLKAFPIWPSNVK